MIENAINAIADIRTLHTHTERETHVYMKCKRNGTLKVWVMWQGRVGMNYVPCKKNIIFPVHKDNMKSNLCLKSKQQNENLSCTDD